MKIRRFFGFIGLLLLVSSCADAPNATKEPEKQSQASVVEVNALDSFIRPEKQFPDGIRLYSLLVREDGPEEKRTLTCFISLSETLDSGDDSGKHAIIPLRYSEADTLERIPIEGAYRNALLKAAGISEKHRVYLYNYATDKLVVMPVSALKSLAILNGYSGREDAPYADYLYQVGFQFDSNILDKLKSHYGSQVVVYIGAENPFVRGEMKLIKWKKRKELEWPGSESASYFRQFKSLKKNNPLSCTLDSLTYWVRDWGSNEFYRDKRELLVVDPSGKMVYTKLLEQSEGCSMAPLNGKYPDFYSKEQFAGHLIKDAGPTFIGFEFYSFSCELFRFLQFPQKQLILNCDSRH